MDLSSIIYAEADRVVSGEIQEGGSIDNREIIQDTWAIKGGEKRTAYEQNYAIAIVHILLSLHVPQTTR